MPQHSRFQRVSGGKDSKFNVGTRRSPIPRKPKSPESRLPETMDTGLSGCSGARMVATPERKKALKSRLQDSLLLLPCHMRARSKNAEFCYLLPDDEDGVQDARN